MMRIVPLLLFTPLLAFAKPVHLVEVASFDCSGSFAMNAFHQDIADAIEETGGTFTFAPIPGSSTHFAREALYYASREYGLADDIRNIFFNAQEHNLVLRRTVEATEWLRLKNIPVDQIDTLLTDVRNDYSAVGRAAAFVSQHNVLSTPTYLLIKEDGSVRKIVLPDDSSERRLKLIEIIEKESERA